MYRRALLFVYVLHVKLLFSYTLLHPAEADSVLTPHRATGFVVTNYKTRDTQCKNSKVIGPSNANRNMQVGKQTKPQASTRLLTVKKEEKKKCANTRIWYKIIPGIIFTFHDIAHLQRRNASRPSEDRTACLCGLVWHIAYNFNCRGYSELRAAP